MSFKSMKKNGEILKCWSWVLEHFRPESGWLTIF